MKSTNMDWLVSDLKIHNISIECGERACKRLCLERGIYYTSDMKYWAELSWSNFYGLSNEEEAKLTNDGKSVDTAVNAFGSSIDDAIKNAVDYFWQLVDEGYKPALEAVSILGIKRNY